MEWKETGKFESGLRVWNHSESDSKDVEIHTYDMVMGWTVSAEGGQVPFNNTLDAAIKLAESLIISRREIAEAKEAARILSEARKEARKARRRKKPAQVAAAG